MIAIAIIPLARGAKTNKIFLIQICKPKSDAFKACTLTLGRMLHWKECCPKYPWVHSTRPYVFSHFLSCVGVCECIWTPFTRSLIYTQKHILQGHWTAKFTQRAFFVLWCTWLPCSLMGLEGRLLFHTQYKAGQGHCNSVLQGRAAPEAREETESVGSGRVLGWMKTWSVRCAHCLESPGKTETTSLWMHYHKDFSRYLAERAIVLYILVFDVIAEGYAT